MKRQYTKDVKEANATEKCMKIHLKLRIRREIDGKLEMKRTTYVEEELMVQSKLALRGSPLALVG